MPCPELPPTLCLPPPSRIKSRPSPQAVSHSPLLLRPCIDLIMQSTLCPTSSPARPPLAALSALWRPRWRSYARLVRLLHRSLFIDDPYLRRTVGAVPALVANILAASGSPRAAPSTSRPSKVPSGGGFQAAPRSSRSSKPLTIEEEIECECFSHSLWLSFPQRPLSSGGLQCPRPCRRLDV